MSSPVCVGRAVAKAQGDSARRPTGARWAGPTDHPGIVPLVPRLQAGVPPRMGLEAPGGDPRAVVAALVTAGLPSAVVPPRHTRDGATAIGALATTAGLEARAMRCRRACGRTSRPLAPGEPRLACTRARGPPCPRHGGRVGAALVGIAPGNRDRGTLRGPRTTWGGRPHGRAVVSMRTRVALRDNPVLKRCSERLRAACTGAKDALTACLRKRLPLLHAMGKPQQPGHGQAGPHASQTRPP
jgi:transposase